MRAMRVVGGAFAIAMAFGVLGCKSAARKEAEAVRKRMVAAIADCNATHLPALKRHARCIVPAANHVKDPPSLAALVTGCGLEQGELAGQLAALETSACLTAVRYGAIPKERAREALLPTCQGVLATSEEITVADLQRTGWSPEASCGWLIENDLLPPEERLSVLRIACLRGALDLCDVLAGDPGTAGVDADRTMAAQQIYASGSRLCSRGNRGGCALLERWVATYPELAQVRAAG